MSELIKKQAKIGICGLGTVASGVVNVLQRNRSLIEQRASCSIEITHVGARRDNSACDISAYKVSRDIFEVVKDPEVNLVIELIGGTTVAKDLVIQAIENGKHVVTANKALIAEHGNELLSLAAEKNVVVLFEAAVAGGIPVIKSLTQGLSGNAILSIAGIINGTGNYILTEMREKQRSFADALADAQALGYAEADPTYDVEGIDAAQKLVILASLAYGIPFEADACFTEGISKLKVEDLEYADQLGYSIKHLGIAKSHGDDLELRVHPTLVSKDKLLAKVHSVMNAVEIIGDAVGPTLFYGAGAGSEPTASAVVSDIVDCVKAISSGYARALATQLGGKQTQTMTILPIEAVESAYYLRITAANEPGVLSQITKILSDQGISAEAVLQRDKFPHQDIIPVILITSLIQEKVFLEALSEIEGLESVKESVVFIRVEK